MFYQNITPIIGMLKTSSLDSNMYVIDNGAILVDTTSGYHAQSVLDTLKAQNIEAKNIPCIINTHSHIDHAGGNHLFENAKIMMHKNAVFSLKCKKNSHALYHKLKLKDPKLHIHLQDGDTIRSKGRKLEIIHAPSHTPDSICIYMPEEKALFTGDTITNISHDCLSRHISTNDADKTLFDKLNSLDIKYLLPGHGAPITDRNEIKNLLSK